MEWASTLKHLTSAFLDSKTEIVVTCLHKEEYQEYKKNVNNKKVKQEISTNTRKAHILGDSHAREMGWMVNSNEEIQGWSTVIPGGSTAEIKQELNSKTSNLGP